MPYVQRENGQIVGRYLLPQPGIAEEFLPEENVEVIESRKPTLSPMDKLEAIISQGQEAMAEAPLPKDLRKEIFDLEVLVRNYFKRGDTDLIKDAINNFVIPEGRQDVTQGQRVQVEALKTEMLAVFSG